eukprot:scaffold12868_cov96-Cylindrotheca_fusiformis.AAC.4
MIGSRRRDLPASKIAAHRIRRKLVFLEERASSVVVLEDYSFSLASDFSRNSENNKRSIMFEMKEGVTLMVE